MTDNPKISADSEAIARCREALDSDDMLSVAQRRDWACLMENYDAASIILEAAREVAGPRPPAWVLLARENGIRASKCLPPLTMAEWEAENPPEKIRPDRLREIADGAMGIGAPLVLTQAEQVSACTELLALREACERKHQDGWAWQQLAQQREAERDRLQQVLLSRHGGEPLALLSELDQARAELEAARDEVTQLEGMERQRDAETERASALEAELAAVKRQRDEAIEKMRELLEWARRHAQWPERWAFDQLGVWRIVASEIRSAIKMQALAAEQPKPQQPEPRPWWVVFGLERHAASRMVASAPKSGPLLVDKSLRHLADEAGKRGVHPAEISRALDEARAELQPKPQGGAS